MITTLQYLGIYEDAIENAVTTAENALTQLDLDYCIDELNESAFEDMKAINDWEHITNTIIAAYFACAQSIIERELPDVDTDYYVNCDDSHFYIGGDEV